jgi:hypothetical protein
LSRQPSLLDFFKSSPGTRVLPHALFDIGDDDPDGPHKFEEEALPP